CVARLVDWWEAAAPRGSGIRNEPRARFRRSASGGLAARLSATGRLRTNKEPWARSGPRLVGAVLRAVSPPAGYIEEGTDRPPSATPKGAAVRRVISLLVISLSRLLRMAGGANIAPAAECTGRPSTVSTPKVRRSSMLPVRGRLLQSGQSDWSV